MTEATKINLTTAAQGEAVTRPAQDTTIGKRTEELNDELKNSDWFRKLREMAFKMGWSREKLDDEVKKHGVR